MTEQPNKNSEEHSEYEAYCDHRNQLEDARSASASLFDKSVLAGAGGGLALSLTLLGVIGKDAKSPWLILLAWSLLALAAGTILLNAHLTYRANTKCIEKADKIYEEHPRQYRNQYLQWDKNSKAHKMIECLNVLALIFLVSGVITLIAFGSLNFN